MAKKKQDSIRVTKPNAKTITIPIVGETPYIPHRPAYQQIAAGQKLPGEDGNIIKKRKVRDLDEEYESCFYYDEDEDYAVPGGAFLSALCEASKDLNGVYATTIRRNIQVVDELCKITEYDAINRRSDFVRQSGRTGALDVRVRPEFINWKTEVTIRFDTDVIPKSSLLNLLVRAGYSIGVGDWRPEQGGRFGTFTIAETNI